MITRPSIYFIMGTNDVENEEPLDVLEEALQSGITHFQLREKGKRALQGSELVAFAQSCQRLCKCYDVPFFINDDLDLARTVQPDGVHLGQEDWNDRMKDEIRESGFLLGRSVQSLQEAEEAILKGADYLGIGSIFPTRSKPDAGQAIGTSLLQEVHQRFPDIPIIGIGGIDSENAQLVWQAGAAGVAVISCISRSSDRRKVVSELRPREVQTGWMR
ncbi:thiamine phosphate synthase [Chryseomicrobium palamuruense]|uniref:Thiamine-phosphate synthase n=1 Tax=Chryseomicrobium palamuruense TaxID=682973 RepID=A0ABV8UST3_9BACL